ncbi:MAG: hypothetical protein IJF54_01610 [Clostridia bacterium]|nr:hypothetical protein [Clostridia bacterium]
MKKLSQVSFYLFITTLFLQGIVFIKACFPPYSLDFKKIAVATERLPMGDVFGIVTVICLVAAALVVLNLIVFVLARLLSRGKFAEQYLLIIQVLAFLVYFLLVSSLCVHGISFLLIVELLALAGASFVISAVILVICYIKKITSMNFWIILFIAITVFQVIFYQGNLIINFIAILLGAITLALNYFAKRA